ncbi:MAG TPA: DNA mismatch repair endonuclease MutL, partial [Thermoanaerobaculia bacterium]
MARVHRLQSSVIDRIAAGEVVEKPASAVKELVENALDASASSIAVEADGGGIERILVRDDGSGMSAEDARLALERHATSKIATDADLAKVASYGFRGEALPSIASVSKLTLTTSDGTSPTGEAVRLTVDYGGRPAEEPAARPRGTDVLVEGLFAKTPARRKFLSSAEAESRAIAAAVTKAALGNPAVAFSLRTNGRETLDAPAAVDRGARILQIFGKATLGELDLFEAKSGPLRLFGYATRGSVTFPTRRFQYLFVNGRPVEDRAISRAIGQASRDAIRTDRHPAVFLFLTAEPGAVDVNVSTGKTQVRFADSATAFRLVYHALNSALLAGKEERRLKPVPPSASGGFVTERESGYGAAPQAPGPPVGVPPPRRPDTPTPAEERKPPDIVPIGQHKESFILASGPDGLLIIDQHAAHERTLYERIRDRIASGRVLSQRLLLRVLFEATPEEAETLAARYEDLSAAGFEIEPMSGRSWAVAALPAEATDRDPAETLRTALAALADSGTADEALRRDRLAASVACRSAVTIRYHLAPEEIRHLITDWAKTRDRFTCPHGRPVVLSMTEEEL